MPFGNESTWDTEFGNCQQIIGLVTNAFRQRVHLGRKSLLSRLLLSLLSPMPFGNESTWDMNPKPPTNRNRRSPMPFGNESTWDTTN